MAYVVKITKKAEKHLQKMDKSNAKIITQWIEDNLSGTENPRAIGKPLIDNPHGNWRYRVGDFRLLCDLQDDVCLVFVVKAGHRREVYR